MSLFTGAALLGAGIAAATGGIAAAKMTSGASTNAADLQAKAAQDALDFTKAQKAKQEAAWQPFANVSGQAATVLPGLVRPNPTGGPPPAYAGPPPLPYMGAPGGGQPPAAPQGAPLNAMGQPPPMAAPSAMTPPGAPNAAGGAPQGQMVMLQAPDGSTKSVPAAQAQFYIQRGAKQVG